MMKKLLTTNLCIVFLATFQSLAFVKEEGPVNKHVKFEQVITGESKFLKMHLKKPGKLIQVRVISITGENLGVYEFNGKKLENLTIDVSKMRTGQHMFKFTFKDRKEVNEIFRLTNK